MTRYHHFWRMEIPRPKVPRDINPREKICRSGLSLRHPSRSGSKNGWHLVVSTISSGSCGEVALSHNGFPPVTLSILFCFIRKNRDYVFGIWQYKVISIKKLFQGEHYLRWKLIGKTWVMYKNTNKGNTSIENSSLFKFTHFCLIRVT